MRRKISEEGGYAVLQPAGREINDWVIEGYQLWAFVIETAVPKLVQSIILFNSNESLVGPENVIEKLFKNTKKQKQKQKTKKKKKESIQKRVVPICKTGPKTVESSTVEQFHLR